MIVRELVEALSKLDPDLVVSGEGCDCINPVVGVTVQPAIPWQSFAFPAQDAFCLIEVDTHA